MGFLSGIFSSKQTSQDIYREDVPVDSLGESLTGVAKYIHEQSDKPVEISRYTKKLSSVGEYIQTRNATAIDLTDVEKDAINARVKATIELRKTEESLMSAENEKLSGVARYVESQEQAIIAAQEEELVETGVAKYLANIIETKPVTTGVAKYLKNRVDATVSSVDRYVIQKSLADKNKPEICIVEPSGVDKYLENRPTLLTSSVAKYIAKQGVAARQAANLTAA